MRTATALCLLLAACGPVLLFGDEVTAGQPALPMQHADAAVVDSGSALAAALAGSGARDAGAAPRALVTVKPTDCSRCFALVASGTGGIAPYQFEWEDGSRSAQRRVCPGQTTVDVVVVAVDANGARSAPDVTRLDVDADASCPQPPEPPATLCIANPSFEGAPAANLGIPQTFDAAPWSTCVNPAVPSSGVANNPDIGTDAAATGTAVPKATDGMTFVSLAVGEQVSQKLCQAVRAGSTRSLRLDVTRVDFGGPAPSGGDAVKLEIWVGFASDCSQHEQLWVSPPLDTAWKTYCVKLKPGELIDQITLRATSKTTALASSFALVDNLVPVDDCP
jgi:hypothetical protein